MKRTRRSLVLAALFVLGVSAFATAGTTSTLSIQAEVPSIDALNCVNSNDGTQLLDFDFTSGGSSLTIGVTCTYTTNDPNGVDISLETTSNLSNGLNQSLALSDCLTWTDGTVTPTALPSLDQTIVLSRGLAVNGASNATISYQITMTLGPNTKTGNYSGGGIVFTIGPTQVV